MRNVSLTENLRIATCLSVVLVRTASGDYSLEDSLLMTHVTSTEQLLSQHIKNIQVGAIVRRIPYLIG